MGKIILTLLVLFNTFSSYSAVRNWVGVGSAVNGAGTVLNNAANWDGTGALLPTDDLVITITRNATNTITLNGNLSVNSLTIVGLVTNVGTGGRTFTLNLGAFALNLASNHLVTNSSTPPGNQNNRPFNIIISNTIAGSFTVGGNLTATNNSTSQSNNSIQYLINGGLTINGSTLANSLNNGTISDVGFFVGNAPAQIRFTGNVTFDDNTSATENIIYLGAISPGATGSIEFKGNVNIGHIASTNSDFATTSVSFDAIGSQTITYGNDKYPFRLSNVIIGNTNSPSLSVATANAVVPDNISGNLTLNNASILDLNSTQWNRHTDGGILLIKNTATLKLGGSGSVPKGGTATLFSGCNFPAGFSTITSDSTSSIVFTGSTQTIPLPTPNFEYGNLNLTGAGTKSLGGNITINRSLEIGTGVTFALGNNNATLKSNAQTTASVRPVNGTITYGTGKFVIERFLKSVASWRLLATPVTAASSPTINEAWREGEPVGTNTRIGYGTRITGPVGMDEYTQRASMKYYNMANNTYVDVNAAALNGPIQKDQGYYVFVRGDRTVPVGGIAGTTNLRIAGHLRTGSHTFSVIKNVAPATGFQSIGNPFASRIDLRNVILASGGVNESFYIWNPNGGTFGVGKFELYHKIGSNFVKLPGGNVLNTIESGQAFFVQNSSTTTDGTITIKQSDKIIGSSLVSRPGVTTPTLEINLYGNDANQNLLDGVFLNFDDNHNNSIDNFDVRKFSNANDNLGLRLGTVILSVERRTALTATDTLRLNISGMRVAAYKLQIDPSVLGNLPLNAFLVDNFLQTETPVSLTDVTHIPFTITNDAASRVANRFMIVFRPAASTPLPVTFLGVSAVKNANKTHTINWRVANETNITNYLIERSADGNVFTAMGTIVATGNNSNMEVYSFVDVAPLNGITYYRVKATSTNGQVQYSNIIKMIENDVKPSFDVYPNPVVNKTVHLRFQNMEGTHSFNLISKQGSTVFSKLITVTANNETQRIILDSDIAAGIYELVIADNKGKRIVETIYIQ